MANENTVFSVSNVASVAAFGRSKHYMATLIAGIMSAKENPQD
jgi:hypothetical protein